MRKAKHTFRVPPYLEQTILDGAGKPCGTFRLKPESIGWKPRGKADFLTVSLETLETWLKDPQTKAKTVK